MKINKETIKRRTSYFIFWSWHLVYIIFALAVLAPFILVPLFMDITNTATPWYYLFYVITIILLPFVSVYLGLLHFKKNYKVLMKYFYGFEMPVFSLFLIKIFSLRELNLAMLFLITIILTTLVLWLVWIWQEHKHQQIPDKLKQSPIALVGSTIIAITGLYFGSLLAIFNLPLAIEFISSLFQAISHLTFSSLAYIIINPLSWIAGLFIIYSMTLFIVLPIAMVWLYTGQIKHFAPLKSTKNKTIVALIFVTIVGVFSISNHQPQKHTFVLLDKNIKSTKSSTLLLEQADSIRKGLLNAYLWPSRYVGTTEANDIAYFYKKSGFHSTIADGMQSIFNFLIHPMLYDGNSYDDREKAKIYYEKFFDQPIQKAERTTILKSLSKRWEVGRNNDASLLAAGQKKVHVTKQSISLSESKGVATITISEVLINKTEGNKEAVIHFSLPGDAVLTGLWLSTEKNNPKMFPYILAPKGAAQAVYKAEVSRRVDPALLEKTGPNQYRLRAYPILPQKEDNKPYFHMQLEYQTIAKANGEWPLPQVLEQRNIYWDDKTQRRINGDDINTQISEQWIPSALATTNQSQQTALTSLAGEHIITAFQRKHENEVPNTDKHVAVLIDGSYSMHTNKAVVIKAYDEIKQTLGDAKFYYCQLECEPLTNKASLNQQVYFGNSQIADHLAAFEKLNQQDNYDAILLLTDEGSYEIKSKADTTALTLSKPLWITHLGGKSPYAYDDRVLDLVYNTHGGITYSTKEALLRLNTASILNAIKLLEHVTILAITEDYIWIEQPLSGKISIPTENIALQKIIAGQQIKNLIRTMDTKQLSNLDEIHHYAKKSGIVTHYSSMIVLVNNRQKEALNKATQDEDRFDREIETGEAGNLFQVTAVPEPEEWALIIISSLLLGTALLRRRRAKRKSIAINLTISI